MLQRLFAKRSDQTVMGYRLEEPRITFIALMWFLLYVGLPVIGLGLLMDFLIEWATGSCVGLWCYF
ncbi:MAG: hypothetical protein RI984_864 [Pseudomonadota bacterium]|jgi:hypothetical protein